MTSVPLETVIRLPVNKEAFAPAGKFRRARTMSAARSPLTQWHLANKKYEGLQQKTREGEEKVWEVFKRQPSPRQRTRTEFEEDFRRKVLSGVFNTCKEEQWKDVQKWIVSYER